MADDPYDMSDEEEQLRVQEELDAIHDFHSKNDFEWVMSDVKGRRFVWSLLEEAGVYNTSFDGTPEGTIFSEGARNIGLKILSKIHEHDPGVYAQMIKEKQEYDRNVIDIQRGTTENTDR